MLRDVFYYGRKPNVHPKEKPAKNLDDARQQSTTEHFWIVNEYCDYTGFDWDFDFDLLPDEFVWHTNCNNAWPSQHQKDSGTWLCPKEYTDHKVYRSDVTPIKRIVDLSNWVFLEKVDKLKFDFSWHPDPTEPEYIYKWGCKYYERELKHVLEYRIPNATQEKWMDEVVELEPNWECLVEIQPVNKQQWDMSWRPDPRDPPFIYVWGNKHIDGTLKSTLEYHVKGATEKKYMTNDVPVLPEWERWKIVERINKTSFDFTWRPDPREPPFIYVWGNKYYSGEYGSTVEYHTPGATEYKYMTNDVELLPKMEHITTLYDIKHFEYTWRPNPKDPPYIYVFGNEYYPAEIDPTITYTVPGATELKYVNDFVATLQNDTKNFKVLYPIIEEEFNFAWHPNPKDPPYIYVWGNQWYDAVKMPTVIYEVEGATEYKYMTDKVATLAPNKTNWIIPKNVYLSDFDFSWYPDPTSPPYIYEFGTQWQKTGGPQYVVQGAIQKTYLDFMKVKKYSEPNNFTIKDGVVVKEFDYSWHPDDTEQPYIYVFGNNQYPAEVMPTITYTVPGATKIKYVDTIKAKLASNFKNWVERLPIDKGRFDFSWVPDPMAPPYIYVFGNQWNDATIEPTLEYHVPGATEYKYIQDIIAYTLPDKSKFTIVNPIVEGSFDFSWRPNPKDPPYVYQFGTQWQKTGGPKYIMKGATEIKYVDKNRASILPQKNNICWNILYNISDFDFSWHPDENDPPFIYIFGNNLYPGEIMPTVKYIVKGATEEKFVPDIIAKLSPNKLNWKIPENINVENFDFSWVPNPKEPAYIYEFGTQHQKNGGPKYIVKGATEIKYIDILKAEALPDTTNWKIPQNIDVSNFDFSWHPDNLSPPYIYQFGTLIDDNDGPRYVPPENNGITVRLLRVEKRILSDVTRSALLDKELPKYYITTTLDELVKQHSTEVFWALNKNINYDNFDFNWRPNIEQARYVHVFGSPESRITQTYFVNGKMYSEGYKSFNFVESNIKVDSEYLSELFKPSDMFFIDRGNPESQERFNELKKLFPNITKTRYLNNWVETIYRCTKRCNTQLAWILNSELDYTNFNFKYYPNPWQMDMIHIFGTQWSHWGTTYMINKDTFFDDTYELGVKFIEHLSNLNFIKGRVAKATSCLYDVYLIDHGNKLDDVKVQLENKTKKTITVVPYKESYLKTFKNLLETLETRKEHYIWICSSVCDYQNFDFSFICDPFAKENLHVFSSNNQKFGDTFLVDVNKLRSLINELKILEEYQKVNYVEHLKVKRLDPPVFVTDEDTHYKSYNQDYDFPYALFYTKDNENLSCNYNEPMSLWASHTKNIEILSTGGSVLAIPKQVKEHISDQLYDYPHIIKSKNIIKSNPLDIVYLSNGEKVADENYEHLLKVTKGLPNRIVRVDGVNGRVAAYHASAQASQTPWAFTVFAKLKVDRNFDWAWQPDRLQIPKHYIFTAKNPVNGLIYGHQAMIAYNKKLVLDNNGTGLDFTLDDPHSVINILSGVATFNTDPYSTWRTAFREVIKLKSDYQDISKKRLEIWLTKAEGDYAESCLQGAKDAVEYYESVHGDIEQLKYSYEWDWLKEYYNRKYK